MGGWAPGGCTACRSHSYSNMLVHLARRQVLRWLEVVEGLTGPQRAAVRAVFDEVSSVFRAEWSKPLQ